MLLMMIASVGAVVSCGPTAPEASRNTIPRSVPDVPPGAEMATARAAFSSGNFGFSARYYEMAAEADAGSMEACLGKAASYDWLYRFDMSDRAYRDCKDIDADSFALHNNIGFSHILRGEYGKASVSFSQAEAIRPGHPLTATNQRILRHASSG